MEVKTEKIEKIEVGMRDYRIWVLKAIYVL